ncbi:MAG: hypothetical protein QF860_00775, partial [Planctomycetota bacterium]|nr:hypothetical protein [Planctomycetota bacterium]
ATLPSLLVVNGGDATLDARSLPDGPLDRAIASLPSFPTDIEVWEDAAYITASGADRIVRVDLPSGAVDDDFVVLPAFSNPWGVAIRDAGRAWVVLSALNAVQAFDPTSGELLGDPVGVGNWPQGCALYGDRLFVAVTGLDFITWEYVDPSVTVIDADTGTLLAELPTHPNAQDVVGWGGRIHAVCTGDYALVESALEVFDAWSLVRVATVTVGGTAGSIAIDESGMGYLGDNGFVHTGLYRYDAATLAMLNGPDDPLSSLPFSAILPDERRATLYGTQYDFFGGVLHRWDLPGLEPAGADAIGGGPVSMALWDLPALDVEIDGPAVVSPGDTYELAVSLENPGDAARRGIVELHAYRPDGSPHGANPILREGPLPVGAGRTLEGSVELQVPPVAPEGSYRLVGRVLDADGGVQHDSSSLPVDVVPAG